jgi:hypothetical protein
MDGQCPHCGSEIVHWDVYGRNLSLDSLGHVRPGFQKSGDIYKCCNEDCDIGIWHTRVDSEDELREGMPC